MKRVLTGLGAALLLSTTAMAADVTPAPAYDWSGAYAGLNGGGDWGTSKWNVPSLGGPYNNYDLSGVVLGGQLGYRLQMNHIVLGVEGDADYANIDGSRLKGGAETDKTNQDFLGSIQGQLGFAFDRVLIYGTGGLAFGDIEQKAFAAGPVGFKFGPNVQTGWTVGVGADYALTDNISFGVRYSYYDFGTHTQTGKGYGGLAGVTSPPVKFNDTENAVTLRVNYRF